MHAKPSRPAQEVLVKLALAVELRTIVAGPVYGVHAVERVLTNSRPEQPVQEVSIKLQWNCELR